MLNKVGLLERMSKSSSEFILARSDLDEQPYQALFSELNVTTLTILRPTCDTTHYVVRGFASKTSAGAGEVPVELLFSLDSSGRIFGLQIDLTIDESASRTFLKLSAHESLIANLSKFHAIIQVGPTPAGDTKLTVTVSGTKAISVGSNQHPTTINFQRFPNSRLLIFTARFGETGIPLQKITDISQTKFLSEGQSGTIEEIPSDFSGEERGQLNLIFAEGEYDPLRNFVTRVRFAVDVKTSYTFANFAKLENVTFFPDIEVDPQGYVSFGLDFSADATVKNYKVRVFGSALDMYFSGIATYQDPPTINVDSEFKGGGLPDSARCQYISVTADLKQKSYSASIGLSTNWEPIPGVKLERVQLDVAGSSTGGVTGRIFGTIAIGNVNLNVCGQKGNQGWSIAGEIFPSDQKETREVLKSKFGLTMPDAMGDVGLTRVGLQYNSVGNRLVVEASGGFYFGNTFINTSLSLKKSGSNEWNIIGDLDLFHVNSQGEARSYSFDIEAAKYASGSAIRASWAAETPVTMAEILDAVSVENVPMLDYLPAISGITFTKSSAGAAVKMTGDSWSTVFVTV